MQLVLGAATGSGQSVLIDRNIRQVLKRNCMGRITDLAGYCISQSKAFITLHCLTSSRGHFKHEAGLRFNIFIIIIIIMFLKG